RALPAAELTLDLVNVRALLQPVTGSITVRCADGLQRDIRLTDSDGNGRLSQGDVVTVPGFECMGVEGSSSFRLTRFNPALPIFEAAVEFAFRQNDGTEIEGSFTLVSNQTET